MNIENVYNTFTSWYLIRSLLRKYPTPLVIGDNENNVKEVPGMQNGVITMKIMLLKIFLGLRFTM